MYRKDLLVSQILKVLLSDPAAAAVATAAIGCDEDVLGHGVTLLSDGSPPCTYAVDGKLAGVVADSY